MRELYSRASFVLAIFVSPLVQAETIFKHSSEHRFLAPHHLSLLSADTHIRGHGDYSTLGLDYEYRVSRLLGIGFVLEYAFDGLDATTALAVADMHLHKGFIMQLGPGIEYVEGKSIYVGRVGVLYEFEFADFTLSPQLHWDFHDGHENAVVAGIAMGFAF